MEIILFTIVYFLLLISIFRLSGLLVNKAILRGYSLEEIKFIVWFFLYSFIIGISVILITLILYQFNLIGFSLLLSLVVVTVIIMILCFIYIIFKFV